MSEDFVSKVDNSPLFQALTSMVMEAPGAITRGLGKVASGIGAAASSVGSVFAAVKDTALGASHSAPSREPEISQSRVQEPQIAVAQERAPAHHFDPADLGELSAPSFVGSHLGSGGLQR